MRQIREVRYDVDNRTLATLVSRKFALPWQSGSTWRRSVREIGVARMGNRPDRSTVALSRHEHGTGVYVGARPGLQTRHCFARGVTEGDVRTVRLCRLRNSAGPFRLREPCRLYCSGFDEKARRIDFASHNDARPDRF